MEIRHMAKEHLRKHIEKKEMPTLNILFSSSSLIYDKNKYYKLDKV